MIAMNEQRRMIRKFVVEKAIFPYLPTTLPYDVPKLLIFSFMDSCPARVICRLPRKPNFFGQLEEDDISRESQIAIATSCNNLILY